MKLSQDSGCYPRRDLGIPIADFNLRPSNAAILYRHRVSGTHFHVSMCPDTRPTSNQPPPMCMTGSPSLDSVIHGGIRPRFHAPGARKHPFIATF